jgi:CheY-like chemotaxis protein
MSHDTISGLCELLHIQPSAFSSKWAEGRHRRQLYKKPPCDTLRRGAANTRQALIACSRTFAECEVAHTSLLAHFSKIRTEQASRQQRSRSSVVVKVLYIEDNDDDVYMLKMRLELLGNFEVLTAEDGVKGCEVAAAEQPDIILMDLEMPVVDGWEAARRLKGNSQTQDIPIIALSAHALAGEREKAIATGCEEFDTKPIEFDRLVATVRRVLDGRK